MNNSVAASSGRITAPMTVPYTCLAQQASEIRPALIEAFESVLDSGRYVLGPHLAAFEQEFADWCQAAGSVGVGNGTEALELALRVLGIGPGDEVITAPNSFIATAAAIHHVGAHPVFADIGRDLNIDPQHVESAITSSTRAIIPVHLTGRPARMPDLLDIAERHGLHVIEDAAQAVGARLHGRRVGSWAPLACFSLHPLKNLHAFGDGGIITVNDVSWAQPLRMARNHGLSSRDRAQSWGHNSRLDELQAALLRVQLPVLERWTTERRELAFRYHDSLRAWVDVPEEGPGEECVYQTYVIQARRRDALRDHLIAHGVEALIHYSTPIHRQPAASSLGYDEGAFPEAERAVRSILSLPLYPGMGHDRQDRVIELIAGFYCRSGMGERVS